MRKKPCITKKILLQWQTEKSAYYGCRLLDDAAGIEEYVAAKLGKE